MQDFTLPSAVGESLRTDFHEQNHFFNALCGNLNGFLLHVE